MSKIYGRGLNFAGQLNSSRKAIKSFTQLEYLRDLPLKGLGCGYLQSFYLLNDNRLIKTGYYLDSLTNVRLINWNRLFPTIFNILHKILFFNKKLASDTQLTLLNASDLSQEIVYHKAIFGHSSIYLIVNGLQIYCIGQNYHGQLGIRHTQSFQKKFELLPNIPEEEIQDVACGFQHTLFLTKSGKLYGCGKADSFQIQPEIYQDNKNQSIITFDKFQQPMLIYKNRKVVKMSAGFKNTMFLTEDNQIYALGSNKYGECGINYENKPQLNSVTRVYLPFDQKIIDMCCGYRHTLLLTDQNVYFTGSVEHNQNPFAKFNENLCSFTILDLPCRPIKIYSKFDRSAIITEDGKLYLFGGRNYSHIGGQSGQFQIVEGFNLTKRSLVGLGYSHTILNP